MIKTAFVLYHVYETGFVSKVTDGKGKSPVESSSSYERVSETILTKPNTRL
jgi:hypothetical protein